MRILISSAVVLICGLTLTPARQTPRPTPIAPQVGSIVVIVREKGVGSIPLVNGDVTATWQVQGRPQLKTVRANRNGEYVIGGLLEGTYRVTATAPDYKQGQGTVKLGKYESVRVNIDLPRMPIRRK